jgi:hypothetical protein
MKNSKRKIQDKKGATSFQLKLDFKEVKKQNSPWIKLKATGKTLAKELVIEVFKVLIEIGIKEMFLK